MRAPLLGLFCLLSILIPICSVSAISYDVVDLTPSGSIGVAYDISGGQQVGDASAGNNFHALLWSGSAASALDLNPAGITDSFATGIAGSQQVGYGYDPASGSNAHAFLWSGSAASAIDLHPLGMISSYGTAISGGKEVGWGILWNGNVGQYETHALLWSGSAASAVDLNPAGFTVSQATAVSGGQQVGFGGVAPSGSSNHALLWSGSAASVLDLNPAGFTTSEAHGVDDGQQVGFGKTGSNNHALLWYGTAASALDLNPAGFTGSLASAILDGQVVGSGYGPNTGFTYHALLWSSSAPGTAVDLHSYLPSGFADSQALGVDAYGNIVGLATESMTGRTHAIAWFVVPEPSTGLLVIAGLLGIAMRRTRH
jgi:hypothetical protein